MNDVAYALQAARKVGPIEPPHAQAHKPHRLHTGPLHSDVAGRTDHLPSQVPNGSFVVPADIVSHLGDGNTMGGYKAIKHMFGGAKRRFGGLPYAGDNGPYGQGMELPYAIEGHAQGGATTIGRNEKQTIIGPGYEEWQAQPGSGVLDADNAITGPIMPGVKDNAILRQLEDNRNQQKAIDEYGGQPIARGGSPDSSQEAVPVAVAGGEYVLSPEEVAWAGGGDLDAGHKALDAFVLRQRAKLINILKKLPPPKKN